MTHGGPFSFNSSEGQSGRDGLPAVAGTARIITGHPLSH